MTKPNCNTNFGTTCRSRELREGWLGRRRNYKCRWCGQMFQVDTRFPLPESERICLKCKTEAPVVVR